MIVRLLPGGPRCQIGPHWLGGWAAWLDAAAE
jgi:hypothetical protein